MNVPSESRLVSSLKVFSRAAGIGAIMVGGLVLVGWAADIPVFKSVLPGLSTMKPNTALSFILLGISLWLTHRGQTRLWSRRAAQVGPTLAVLVGLLTLSQDMFGWDLGIDQLLFKEVVEAGTVGQPGRMSPATALTFILSGCALLPLNGQHRTIRLAAQILAVAGGIVAVFALTGYIYNVQSLYQFNPTSSIALHTALAFLLLNAGTLCAFPQLGLMLVLTSDTVGGVMARRLLPFVIGVPFVLGWLELLGTRAGLYQVDFGIALFAAGSIIIFASVIGWSAIKLTQGDAARRRAEERFRLVVESIPNAIVGVSQDGKMVLVNAQIEKIFGYGREELLGRPIEILVPERFRHQHPNYRAAFFSEPQTRAMGVGRDLYGLHKDGSEMPLEIGLNPIQTAEGILVLSAIVDITERKRGEEELRRTGAELARSNAELEQFAYVASHDLQEPLRAVAGTVQLLQQGYQNQLDARADELIAHAVDGATRMQTLIADLLAFSRVGTRGQPFQSSDCKAILERVLANLEVAVQESGAVITHSELPCLNVDPTQMSQLFQNLIGNAIKFRGERPPEICVRAARQQDEWLFSIQDNGIGIEAEYSERIFGIFQRLHTRREYPGTGIGLAICKKIVERHGGHIWVESTAEKGSTFYFTISNRR